MPSFVAQQRQKHDVVRMETTADPDKLKGKQLEAYTIVSDHCKSTDPDQDALRLVVSGTAGTGKSYLIQCLKQLLGDRLCVAAPTGAAAYNVIGYTLHSLLSLPIRAEFKELEGKLLRTLQESLMGVSYLVIVEMSMVGRKVWTN